MFKFKNAWIYSVIACILLVIVPIIAPSYDAPLEKLPMDQLLLGLSAATFSYAGICVCMFAACMMYTIIFEERSNIATSEFRKYAIRTLLTTLMTIIIGTFSILYFGISNDFCLFVLILSYYPIVPLPIILLCMIIKSKHKSKTQG